MKKSELRQLIREELGVLTESKHVTDVPIKFTRWIPEISPKLFTNFKINYVEISLESPSGTRPTSVFRYERKKS